MVIRSLKRIIKSSLFKNTASLFILQLVNYLAPLVVLPILGRSLSVTEFGLVSITISIIQLSNIITDYGFTYYATCEISLHRSERPYIQKLISGIFSAKIILLVIVFLFFGFGSFFYDSHVYVKYIIAAVIAIIAQAFQPIWFFQGIEKMKNLTLYTVASKMFYIVFICFFVRDSGDGVKAILSFGIAQVIGTLIALYEMSKEGYRFKFSSLRVGGKFLKETQGFFWARLSAAAYSSANSVFIGGLYGPIQSAYYAAAEQLYKICIFAPVPINQSLYPYMVRKKNWKVFLSILLGMSVIMILGSLIVFFYAEDILNILFGKNYFPSVNVVRILMVAVVLNYISSNLGYPLFGALGKPNAANLPIILCAIFYGVFISVLYFFHIGNLEWIAWGVVLTEIAMISLNLIFSYQILKGEN